MAKKRLLLIQPHSDDIVFSCFKYARLKDQYDITMLTVESSTEKRIKEDEKFCEEMGIKFTHLNIDYVDNTYYGFFKKYKVADDENSLDWCVDQLGIDVVEEIEEQLEEYIQNFKSQPGESMIMAPLGVGHPAHRMVSMFVEDHCDLLFRDFPHSYKRRGEAQLKNMLVDYEKVEGTSNPFEFQDQKYDILKRIYKSQSSLLFYEKRFIDRKIDEEYYIKK